jgi:hypothetical protein
MEEFEIGEIVQGRVCGTFRICEFVTCYDMPSVRLKEVHPDDHAHESRSPKLMMPVDSIRKLD